MNMIGSINYLPFGFVQAQARASAGGWVARGALVPPGRPRSAKNSMFLDFFWKNSIFYVVFRQKVGSCPPPWKVFALPWKKVCGRP